MSTPFDLETARRLTRLDSSNGTCIVLREHLRDAIDEIGRLLLQLAAETARAEKAERRNAEYARLDKTRCEQIDAALALGAEDLGAADARFRKTERLKRAVRRAWSRSDRYGPVADGSPYAAGYYTARACFLKAAEAAKESKP